MKVLLFNKQNKTLLKVGKILRKVLKAHMTQLRKSLDKSGVRSSKQLDKKLNKQAKL
jgi:hypothetical protein